MSQRIDLTGRRFGRLSVLRPVVSEGRRLRWLCKCDCGSEKVVTGEKLRYGETKSCGCFQREVRGANRLTHGGTRTPEYRAWCHAIERCENPNVRNFRDYGGRGISMCDRWRNSFANFLADMGPRPSPRHSIDRINNDGNYEPENCRWATKPEQARNTRYSRVIEAYGQSLNLEDWAIRTGIHKTTLAGRLDRGWKPEDAFSRPSDSRRGRRKAVQA